MDAVSVGFEIWSCFGGLGIEGLGLEIGNTGFGCEGRDGCDGRVAVEYGTNDDDLDLIPVVFGGLASRIRPWG
jgi:hypothetical protein